MAKKKRLQQGTKRGTFVYSLQTALEIGEVIYQPKGKMKIVFRLASMILPFFR